MHYNALFAHSWMQWMGHDTYFYLMMTKRTISNFWVSHKQRSVSMWRRIPPATIEPLLGPFYRPPFIYSTRTSFNRPTLGCGVGINIQPRRVDSRSKNSRLPTETKRESIYVPRRDTKNQNRCAGNVVADCNRRTDQRSRSLFLLMRRVACCGHPPRRHRSRSRRCSPPKKLYLNCAYSDCKLLLIVFPHVHDIWPLKRIYVYILYIDQSLQNAIATIYLYIVLGTGKYLWLLRYFWFYWQNVSLSLQHYFWLLFIY